MEKIVYIIGLSVVLISCIKKQQTNNVGSKDEISTNQVLDNKSKSATTKKEYFPNTEEFKKFILNNKWVSLRGDDPCDSGRTINIIEGYLHEYTGMEPIKCKIESIKQINTKTLEIRIENDCNYGNIFKVEILDLKAKLVKWSFYNGISYKAKPYDIVCKDWNTEPKEKEPYYTSLYDINKSKLTVDNKWRGVYYFKGGESNLDYILDLKKDNISLTVQALRYHGYVDQLKTVQVGDTLGLYHHKNTSGRNYEEDRLYNFLKFYKSSDGKFYFEGKLPYLPNGAVEFEKVK